MIQASGRAAELSEAQLMAMTVANTGMAVTTDIGNARDIHPKNKQDVGKRLAFWALNKTYGIKMLGGCCGTGVEHLRYLVENCR